MFTLTKILINSSAIQNPQKNNIMAQSEKKKPGRPKGSTNKKPGRPKGSTNVKKKPGRPKGIKLQASSATRTVTIPASLADKIQGLTLLGKGGEIEAALDKLIK